ncbi:cysteine desulfurase family protein [Rhabdaerophilum sp. SD176]|uniref:cysteine desulfurase family protein n=1 Tax=Rhabdaerophilum sp. SD176 TaxID=2983548 RepID=UPI0024DF963B|nr:cysteine desulfurase family protein [Rhabdaerophilum sp. SD176]
MGAGRAYLDWNATAPLHPAAREAVVRALDTPGNPSSIHAEGRAARALVEAARRDVAALVGGEAENVVFTSGATEAANAILRAGLQMACALVPGAALPARPVIAAAIEHAAILQPIEAAGLPSGYRIALPVTSDGLVRESALAAALAAARAVAPAQTPMVLLQLANNETGVIQPVAELAALVREAGGIVVVDAVQGPGRMALDINTLGADVLFLSAHKFGGPKGVGAIVFARGEVRLQRAFIAGGGQESGQRGGTENIAGIAGMGAAARAVRAMPEAPQAMIQLRDEFENRLNHLAADVEIVGKDVSRLPNTTCFAISGLPAAQALIAFDLNGVAVSSGSACSSGKVRSSHVLEAMGKPAWIRESAIRVSIGPDTSRADLDRCFASLEKQLARRRAPGQSASAA